MTQGKRCDHTVNQEQLHKRLAAHPQWEIKSMDTALFVKEPDDITNWWHRMEEASTSSFITRYRSVTTT